MARSWLVFVATAGMPSAGMSSDALGAHSCMPPLLQHSSLGTPLPLHPLDPYIPITARKLANSPERRTAEDKIKGTGFYNAFHNPKNTNCNPAVLARAWPSYPACGPQGCCDLSTTPFSNEGLRQLLSGKKLWFMGDSTIGNMHDYLVQQVFKVPKAEVDKLRSAGYKTGYERRKQTGKGWWEDPKGIIIDAAGWTGHAVDQDASFGPNRVNVAFGEDFTVGVVEKDVLVLNSNGLWGLFGTNKTWAQATRHTKHLVSKFVKGYCAARASPAAVARRKAGRPLLVLWTLTNAVDDDKTHINPEYEHPLLYEKYCRQLNEFEIKTVRELLHGQPGCTDGEIVFVDMHSLTFALPECVEYGDGRHFKEVQPQVWNWLASAIQRWA